MRRSCKLFSVLPTHDFLNLSFISEIWKSDPTNLKRALKGVLKAKAPAVSKDSDDDDVT